MRGKICFDPVCQFRQRLRECVFEDDENFSRRSVGQRVLQNGVGRGKNVFGEENAQLPVGLNGSLNHGHGSNVESRRESFEFLF